jgi:uridine phosphorylase
MEFHIQCDPKDIAPYVFLPGDPARARRIAAHFDNARFVSDSRGYSVYTGIVSGIPMTVCSTGIGGPQAAIGIEELGHMGANTFIRVGSCGALQDNMIVGDVIIATGVVRYGATANRYLPPAFPAAPDFWMLTALMQAAKKLSIPVQIGLDAAVDGFYVEGDPAVWAKLKRAGVKSVEMEADTLFVISSLRGWRSAALFASDGVSSEIKPAWGEAAFRKGEENEIRIAVEAMLTVAGGDRASGRYSPPEKA